MKVRGQNRRGPLGLQARQLKEAEARDVRSADCFNVSSTERNPGLRGTLQK